MKLWIFLVIMIVFGFLVTGCYSFAYRYTCPKCKIVRVVRARYPLTEYQKMYLNNTACFVCMSNGIMKGDKK